MPGSRVKVVQPLQKGVIKKILVNEGDYVTKGDALIELDGTQPKADENRLSKDLANTKLKLAVNEALLRNLDRDENNSEQLDETNLDSGQLLEVLPAGQSIFKKLLHEKWLQYQARLSTLLSAHEAVAAEYNQVEIEIDKLSSTLPIISKRAKMARDLFKKKYASEAEYLQLEQERIEQSHQLAAEKQHLNQLQATREQAQRQIDTLRAESKAGILAELTDYRRDIAALQEELVKASDANNRQILYAPVSGQVQELAVTTEGGVVTEAEPLMKIVPDEESLIVEVFLENKDIGFVEKDMPAEVKIHTFPFTKYGIVEAEIENISDDAIFDEKRGFTYSMLLAMKKKTIAVEGRDVRLMPGMEVTAEIKTGERRLIEYFLAPLLLHGQESLRER
jgi:hemolysin D